MNKNQRFQEKVDRILSKCQIYVYYKNLNIANFYRVSFSKIINNFSSNKHGAFPKINRSYHL